MRFLLAGLFTFSSLFLLAQEEITSDRPGQSFSAQILGKGGLQWQQGFAWRDFYTDEANEQIFVQQRQLSTDVALRYGLGYGLEAGLAWQYTGINNPWFNAEYRWEGVSPRLHFRIALPGSTENFHWALVTQSSFDILDYRLSASIFDGPFGITGNLGYYHDDFIDYTVQWTVLLSYTKEYYSVFAEVYGLSLNSANADNLGFDAGFSFQLSPRFLWDIYAGNQIGIGPGVGLFSNYFLNTGFSWRIL